MLTGAGLCKPSLSQSASSEGNAIVQVKLGQSMVALNGPWKFTTGDSPLDTQTGKPLWAEGGFDDSRWETVDFTPETGALNPTSGLSGYVPGWTAKGHPGYSGYAWYRIRVGLQSRPHEKLAMAGPPDVDDVYQAFDDGELIGSFGDFSGKTPVMYYSEPMLFDLPQTGSSGAVLAFRVWMHPNTLTNQPDAGGFHNAPLVGEAGAVAAGYRMRWLELVQSYSTTVVEALVFALLALMAFSLMLFDPSDRVYLWIGAVFLNYVAAYTLLTLASWTQSISILTFSLMADGFLGPLLFAGWVMVWWVWFGRQRPAWLPIAAFCLAILDAVSSTIGSELFSSLVSHSVARDFAAASLIVRLLFLGLMLWIDFQGIRKQGVEGWLVLPAILLRGAAAFQNELGVLHIRVSWHPFGVSIGIGAMANLLLAAVLVVLLLRRLLLSVRRQRMMALDVKQAQAVQQMILPEAQVSYAGLAVETIYRPAREVGGDFFQMIPHATDGSLLIVAGDVAGKGLQAGMLVALLVGAIRMAAEVEDDPLSLLKALNRRLMGRGEAAATCLAMRIGADGEVKLANAGHMPPYRNGEPVAMEGALPLGMFELAEFSVMHFVLDDGDTIFVMSDGIVEAMDANGNLFGFERIQTLLGLGATASQLADAAQEFGQEDDMSVISLTRSPVSRLALA